MTKQNSASWRVGQLLRCLVLLPALLYATSCTDGTGGTLTDPGARGVRLSLVPQFNFTGAALAPIVRARVTVLQQPGNVKLFTDTIPLNPDDPSWDLKVEFAPPGNVTVVVLVELLSEVGIEWSGKTSPIAVTPSANTQPPAPIQLYQGPPANLEVQGVEITTAPASLVEGDSSVVLAVISPVGVGQVFWSSLDTLVGRVDATGKVRTLRDGSLRIRATAGPREDTVTINVLQRAASVRIQPDTARAASVGEAVAFTAAVLDPRGAPITGATVTWSSQHPAIAESQGNGSFIARANGIATVVATATAAPAISGNARVVVAQRAAGVQIEASTAVFDAIGATAQFAATVIDGNGNVIANAPVTWSSSQNGVAVVDNSGFVTTRGLGTARITVTAGPGVTAFIDISVQPAVASVAVTPTPHSFSAIGDSTRFTARALDRNGNELPASFTWASSNTAVVTVDASGMVRAVGVGSAQVRATTGTTTGAADVTVALVFTRLEVTPALDTLRALGATRAFTARGFDRNGNSAPATPAWSSSDLAVASIDANGVATAVGVGTTTITARSGDATTTATLVVAQREGAVEISPDSLPVPGAGTTGQFTAVVKDARGNAIAGAAVAWSSLDPQTATVDAQGLVTGVKRGVARIVATSGTAADTARAFVAGTTLQLAPDTIRLSASFDTASFTATVRNAAGQVLSGQRITWTSVQPLLVSVDSTGKVRALNAGTVQIIAATADAADTATVVFQPVARSITVTPAADTVLVGQSIALSAQALDARGVAVSATMTWTSSDTMVARVDSDGNVTGVLGGLAEITVRSGDVTATAQVLVVGVIDLQLVDLVVVPGDTIAPGDSVRFSVTIRNAGTQPAPATQLLIRARNAGNNATLYDTVMPVPALEPRGTFNFTLRQRIDPNAPLPPAVSILAFVDPANTVPESDETNNQLARGPIVVRGVVPIAGNIPADHVLRVGEIVDLSSVIPGAAWSADAYWVASVDTAGVVTALDHGAVAIIATDGATADTTFIWVVPNNVSHIWVGTDPGTNSWQNPSNWHNADVPGAGDDVMLPHCYYYRTSCVYPVLDGAVAVRNLISGVPEYYFYDNVVEMYRQQPETRAPQVLRPTAQLKTDARADSIRAQREDTRKTALARQVKRVRTQPKRREEPVVSEEVAELRSTLALSSEYYGQVDLNGFLLDVTGFIDLLDVVSPDGTGTMRLSGSEQMVRGLDLYGNLEITGLVHVGSTGDYCEECYSEYYPGADIYGNLSIFGNAAFNGYVDGDINVTGSLLVPDWLYGDGDFTAIDADVTLLTYAYLEVYGNMTSTGGRVDMQGYGDLEIYGGWDANGTEILVNNGYVEVGDWYYDCTSSDVDGPFTLTNGASITLLGYGGVDAYGDFSLLSGSSLSMQSGGWFYIYGDAIFDGASTAGQLVQGYMYFAGDLTVGNSSTPTAYAPTGTFETGFGYAYEAGVHVITMANPGPTGNRFMHVDNGSAALQFVNPTWIMGSLYTNGPVMAPDLFVGGYFDGNISIEITNTLQAIGGLDANDTEVTATNVTVGGALHASSDLGTAWNVAQTTLTNVNGTHVDADLTGTVTFTGTPDIYELNVNGNVIVSGAGILEVENDIDVTGNVTVTGTGMIDATYGTLAIGGTLSTNSGGRVRLAYSAQIVVDGAVTFNGAANTLEGGNLKVMGDLTAGSGLLGASGTNQVTLNGTALQVVNVPDAFQNVLLSNPVGARIVHDMVVNDFFASNGGKVLADAVHHVKARNATVSNFTASRVWLDFGNTTDTNTIDVTNLTFMGFQSGDAVPTQLRLSFPNTNTLYRDNFTFDPTATGHFVQVYGPAFDVRLTTVSPVDDARWFATPGSQLYINGVYKAPPTLP